MGYVSSYPQINNDGEKILTFQPPSSLYHIGVQGPPNSYFMIELNGEKTKPRIILGQAGQWEIYSKDLGNLITNVTLQEDQICYIEYESSE